MITSTPHTPTQSVTWPPDRFYWVVIEPAGLQPTGWRHDGAIPTGLLAEIADQVPLPIEDLHGAGAVANDGRLVACLARREELLALTDDASVRALRPTAIPHTIDGGAALSPERLNMLICAFEPLALRRTRAHRHIFAAAAVLLLTGLVAIGSSRRERSAHASIDRIQLSSRELLGDLGFTADGAKGLSMALEHRRRIAGVNLEARKAPNAAAALNQLLALWPTASSARLQSISLGPDGAVMSVLLPSPGDPAEFLTKLKPIEGWTLEEPRLVAIGSETRMTLRLRPPAAPPPSPATRLASATAPSASGSQP